METQTPQRWVGLDWSDTEHSVHVIDEQGKVVARFVAAHSAEGLEELVAHLRELGPVVGIALEDTRNLVAVKLLQTSLHVYPINPKVSAAWRDGWSVAGAKSDPTDAEVLAHGLRQYHDRLRRLQPDDPETRTLALLCQDEQDLIGHQTALVNALQATLKQYYPTLREWFKDWTRPSAWNFLLQFPRPQDLQEASPQKLRRVLKALRLGLGPVWEERLGNRSTLAAWPCDPALAAAKSQYAMALARQLLTLNKTLKAYRQQIETRFKAHPDATLFASLPGAGDKLAPRLLSHFGADRDRYESARSLQQLSGCVPVTKSSGGKGKRQPKRREVIFRWACQKNFRQTMHLFAEQSLRSSVWARAFYDQARRGGQSHPLALRNLSAKWLKIIYRMWLTRTHYDETLYLTALLRHGSPLVTEIASTGHGGKPADNSHPNP